MFYLILIILLLLISFKYAEGFKAEHNFLYAQLYDKVFNDLPTYDRDTETIRKYISKRGKILDLGCGTGHHLDRLPQYERTGIENNPDFVKIAKMRLKDVDIIENSIEKTNLLNSEFDAILAMNDTLYYADNNIDVIFSKVSQWLKPNGYFFFNILIPKQLDPGPRQFSNYIRRKDGTTVAITYFDGFTHEAFWTINNPEYIYNQKFIVPNGNKATIATKLVINSRVDILDKLNSTGLKVVDIIDYKDLYDASMELYICKKTIRV